jgi:dGTPase
MWRHKPASLASQHPCAAHLPLPAPDPQRARVIADFIAGMSDRFAMQACTAIYGERPGGLINV